VTTPSRTGQSVALLRATLERPSTPHGDPDAQRKLCAGMPPTEASPRFHRFLRVRTRFVDDRVLAAQRAGIRQVVIVGAGYDDRALRFAAPGVRFTEIDREPTQQDKQARLAAMSAPTGAATGVEAGSAGAELGVDLSGGTGVPVGTGVDTPVGVGAGAIGFVPADLVTDRIADVLAAARLTPARFTAAEPALFICEGLLVYLPEPTVRALLTGLAEHTAPGSELVATLSTGTPTPPRPDSDEPRRTTLPAEDYLALVRDCGWRPQEVQAPGTRGRTLLITATPGIG
jgi:O-methyltransferase involved in polyketide biosynthesis